jgi:adenine-specific DNA-methyltransferase
MLNDSHWAQILDALGAPYYQSDAVLLYQSDCEELLRRLGRECIDLVITSPPYNIGKEYEQPLPLHEYLAWCESWLTLLFGVTNPQGQFWLNLGYVPVPEMGKGVPLPYLLWDKSPFFLVQEIVWNYGAGVAARESFSPRNEKWLWYVKDPNNYHFDLDSIRDPDVKYPNQKKNGVLKCNPLGKNPSDVWNIPKVTSGTNRSSPERTPHPAQFPRAVVERIVKACSTPGSVLLDPFIGSGTVAEVGTALGRRVVGFDVNATYLDLAVKRLDKLRRQQ